ncbi:MAG: Dabb family protein [Lachnospiraceae bacterium]|nr:Dabb family protein [Lachnospiraceae bacterium]MDE6233726.1 Dabb family protein [Lachnospiraceae bacterium]MDE6253130.1 Dabb family protein [Lachnospiraceae bacterium]
MVKHIILWKIKDDIDNAQKDVIKSNVKAGLEGLKGKIPGLIDIHVQTESLSSSNADLMLDSTFEDEEALSRYSVHPEHVKVADNDVRPYMMTRMCLDFEQ